MPRRGKTIIASAVCCALALGASAASAAASIQPPAHAAHAAPAAPSASGARVPVPWNANYHDFGKSSSSYVFVFTNPRGTPLIGVPAPFHRKEFRVAANTCATAVVPGGRCVVKVSYAADGKPIADTLRMRFSSPTGEPTPQPWVQLFAGGEGYMHTTHINGAFIIPAVPAIGAVGARTADPAIPPIEIVIWYWSHPGPPYGPIDFPPPDLNFLTVVANTCTKPIGQSERCEVTLRAALNRGTQRTANFQMRFESARTGASVPTQDVTIIQRAG